MRNMSDVYILTTPREITEPGRERDNNRGSPSSFSVGVQSNSGLSNPISKTCLEPLRGGGDKDISSAYCSDGGVNTRGGGMEGRTGVCICRKLGSF